MFKMINVKIITIKKDQGIMKQTLAEIKQKHIK